MGWNEVKIMKNYREVLLIILGLVVSSLTVFGLPALPDGSTVTLGASDDNSTNDAGNVTAEGGNYTEMNASISDQTEKWSLFYGSITSVIKLKNNNNNEAYSWPGESNPTGYIFFANSTGISWASLAGTGADRRSDENTALNHGSADDNMTNTFSGVPTHPRINYTGINNQIDANAGYALKTKNSTADDKWATIMAWQGTSIAYCGFINQSGWTNFKGDTVDYQVMIPTDPTNDRLYYVYLAIE